MWWGRGGGGVAGAKRIADSVWGGVEVEWCIGGAWCGSTSVLRGRMLGAPGGWCARDADNEE